MIFHDHSDIVASLFMFYSFIIIPIFNLIHLRHTRTVYYYYLTTIRINNKNIKTALTCRNMVCYIRVLSHTHVKT